MPTEIAEIRSPAGARFYRCALQVNPHHYGRTFRGQESDGNAISHAQAIVEKAVEIGIEVLAVTDHNSVSSIAAFRSASRNRRVHIVPGFELASSEGVHVLCLYPPDTELDRIERFLGKFGIHDTHPSSDPAKTPFATVLEDVHRQGGISRGKRGTIDSWFGFGRSAGMREGTDRKPPRSPEVLTATIA